MSKLLNKDGSFGQRTLDNFKKAGIKIPYLPNGEIDLRLLKERTDALVKKPGIFGRLMGKK
jgi:hypothetical protein